MKRFLYLFLSALPTVLVNLSLANPTVAQIIPDTTLPVNSTVVQQGNINIIEGGTNAGTNLFHSWQEFSIPSGTEAFFNNALDIQNIFMRVTGNSISRIDGLIRNNGSASLFLINPNGIIFGSNGSLNIGGSFLASTSSSIKFADGIEFSATRLNAPPLITINQPIGLQFEANPGEITVLGVGNNLSIEPQTAALIRDKRPVGLQVTGQTLALVGGNINLTGGNLTAQAGRIELGSVAGGSLVTLTPLQPVNLQAKGSIWGLSYENVRNFLDIRLLQAASIDSSGSRGGDIQVWARRLTLKDGSVILANTLGAETGGNLIVKASQAVELIGTSVDGQFPGGLFARGEGGSTGNSGDVKINTATLLVRDGAQIGTGTFGAGKGGNLIVNASQQVQLIGTSASTGLPSALGSRAAPGSTGDGGNVTINTSELMIRDGSRLGARSLGGGNAGIVNINADSIWLENQVFLSTDSRSINALPTQEQATINLSSRNLVLRRNSQISTNAQGNNAIGGNINIVTNTLVALENSDISANSQNFKGGQVRINTQAIFGTQFRGQTTINSDITASGGSSQLNGMVEINSPDIKPNAQLPKLSINSVDSSYFITASCNSRQLNRNQFIVTGRGGLPANPYDELVSRYEATDIRSHPIATGTRSTNHRDRPEQPIHIVEASGWIIDPSGKVVLAATSPALTTYSPALTSTACQMFE